MGLDPVKWYQKEATPYWPFFIVFLTDAMGMNAALAGTIPMVGKIWDAITDPIMGNITERTHSKFGAKRFYILIGSFASAITFVLIWMKKASWKLILQS